MSLEETLNQINSKFTHIEIFGLGYVGFPLAVRLSSSGLKVIGIDTNQERIKRLEKNELMDSEKNLRKEFLKCRNKNDFKLQNNPIKISNSKIGIICVPTPIPSQYIKSDVFVKAAVESFLSTSNPGDIIILESSIEVGTTEKIREIIESKGYIVGKNFGLCFCPERIDPANKEWGIENIARVIYCSDDISFKISKRIYENVNNGNLHRVSSSKIVEIVKSFENAFRLVNITLVNELAILCDSLEINVKEVIDAAATKPFGFLAHYPGAGAGGHCIPKDPRFLLESAKKRNLNFETIEHALKINQYMPKYICNSVEAKLNEMGLEKTILVCGLAYKANVEDMRDSPSFKIIQEMEKRGFIVYGYDPFFDSNLSKKYLIENHISELNFKNLDNIDDESIKEISCLCIVQHHDESKTRIKEIYDNSIIPFIYDCQSKLQKNPQSNSQLDFLGN
jgi:UDP-N-acetyl-D-glucosamine dehydrogenase